MKKQTKINYILTLILVFCIGASIPVLTGSSQVTEQHSAKSEVPYCVTSPTVPAQVTFDGETIDLRKHFWSPIPPAILLMDTEVRKLQTSQVSKRLLTELRKSCRTIMVCQ